MASIPVLNPSELKAHLGLLRAFHDLERRVKDGSKLESEVYAFSPEERWESFVQASVERFHTWVSSLKVDGNDIVERVECPSLDVCLVWHAYMLNPSRYAKDTERLEALKSLKVLRSSLLDLFTSDSPEGDIALRGSKTGLASDILTSSATSSIKGRSYPFSLDLSAAVLRQTGFTRKMVKLGWTERELFNAPNNSDILQRCIARYQGFLELMASVPNTPFVPTLDIDLAWHTHQLHPIRYALGCREYAKRFVDHDDTIEGTRLPNLFNITCYTWEERFGVPYSFCSGTKAGLKPTEYSSLKGSERQIVALNAVGAVEIVPEFALEPVPEIALGAVPVMDLSRKMMEFSFVNINLANVTLFGRVIDIGSVSVFVTTQGMYQRMN